MDGINERTGPLCHAVADRVPPPAGRADAGWHLEDIDPEAGTVRVGFDARPEFANPIGVIQGGFLAAMLDDTMGPALVGTLEPDQLAPTLELKINLLRSAGPGRLVGTPA
jgi:acyl-coenzyme A thioesterase PaaI-like protein